MWLYVGIDATGDFAEVKLVNGADYGGETPIAEYRAASHLEGLGGNLSYCYNDKTHLFDLFEVDISIPTISYLAWEKGR